jgi:hypothetical protein
VGAVGDQQSQAGNQIGWRGKRDEVAADAGCVSDDQGIAGIGLGLASERWGHPIDGAARHVHDRMAGYRE